MIEKCKSYLREKISKKMLLIGASLSVALITAITIVNLRKTVVINIEGNKEEIITYKNTVEEVLQTNEIIINDKDKVQPSLETNISEGDTINIERAVEIKVTANNKTFTLKTAEETVADMIEEESKTLRNEGVLFNEGVDEITPSLETKIEENLEVTLVKIEEYNLVESESIDFDVVTEEDSNLDKSVEQVRQEGVSGEKEVTYRVTKKDGVEVSKEIVGTEVTKEPVNKVIVQGTRQTFVSRDEEVLDYKQLIYCESTAYSGGGITATGRVPVYNPGGISTIAVDPRVIPLGSLVYVEGYGKAIAADTGGAIKGNIVDVYLNSQEDALNNWGRKYNVAVYVLAYPGEW